MQPKYSLLTPVLCAAESIGYTPDAPLAGEASTQKSVLAHNFFWLADSTFQSTIMTRIAHLLPASMDGMKLMGVNARCRLYRYIPGAIYRPHIDGAWPASGLVDGEYRYDMNGSSISLRHATITAHVLDIPQR
jgi:hypothetical protein